MKQLDLRSILFNVAGFGVVAFLAVYVVDSFFKSNVVARCTQRYESGQQFSLANQKGAALSPLEFQARLPSRQWGILDNARVVEATDKSAMYLQVAMAPDEESGQNDDPIATGTNGIGFVWQPQTIAGARSACLAYRVFLPKDFAFSGPGVLPGLFATDAAELDKPQPVAGFASRLGWQKDGVLGLEIRSPLTSGQWMGAKGMVWPTNRWVNIEQEIVLNSPQKANGTVRLWVDGELKVENTAINLGADERATLSGVVADVGYNRNKQYAGRLTLSPFIIQKQ